MADLSARPVRLNTYVGHVFRVRNKAFDKKFVAEFVVLGSGLVTVPKDR